MCVYFLIMCHCDEKQTVRRNEKKTTTGTEKEILCIEKALGAAPLTACDTCDRLLF